MNALSMLTLVVLFLWAVGEAFSWPLVPDAALAVVVFVSPELAALSLAVVVLGTSLGGTVGVALWRRGRRWPLPMTTALMRDKVRLWLDGGPTGLIYQPFTGVPYKLFVVEAARRGFGQLAWAGLTAVLRGTRMVTVTVLALAASAIVTALAPAGMVGSLKLAVVAVGLVLFVIGLRVVWNVWANRTVDPRQRSGNHPGQVGDRAIVPHSGRSGRRGRMLPTHRQRGVDARTKSRRSSFPRRLRPPSG